MNLSPQHLFSKADQSFTHQKIIQFPVVRIFLAILFIVPAAIFMSFFTEELHGVEKQETTEVWMVGAGQLISFLAMITLSALYVFLVERRKAWEYGLNNSIGETMVGVGIGALLISVVAFVNYALGYYQIEGFSWHSGLWKWTFIFWTAALFEEILLRAIIFKITEEYLGSWISIIIQALMFGFMHAGNPDASLWSSIAITIEAGILLAASFMLTRRIWLAFGLHFGWNWFQGVFYGIDVSGNDINGIIQHTITGPELITGGEFGFETSIIAVVVCTAAGVLILRRAIKQGQLVKPFWQRSKEV